MLPAMKGLTCVNMQSDSVLQVFAKGNYIYVFRQSLGRSNMNIRDSSSYSRDVSPVDKAYPKVGLRGRSGILRCLTRMSFV